MSRKLFEKPLAIMQNIRFRSGSLDSQLVAGDKSDTALSLASDSEDGKENDSTRAVDIPNQRASLGDKPSSPEKKPSRKKPKGTVEYEVAMRDSLESIAAHHDTTPSELMKLNRLVSRMIFPGQVLYIPDPDYVSSCSDQEPSSPELSISPHSLSPPPENRIRVDVPLVKMADQPPPRVPGHVERQTSLKAEAEPIPQKLSEEEAKQLDQECYERFIKINVKHITDGQGVVSGTLIVTPNAVMFDPNVSDPLVIEHGAETYGVITPMDMVISAAMYHDIAVMRLRGRKNEDQPTSPRPEVYHDKDCPLFHTRAALHDKTKDAVDGNEAFPLPDVKPSRSSTVESLKSETNSICSCGVISRDQSVNIESPDLNGNEKLPGEEVEASPLGVGTSKSGLDSQEAESELSRQETDSGDTMGAVKSKLGGRGSKLDDNIPSNLGEGENMLVGENNNTGAKGAIADLNVVCDHSGGELNVTDTMEEDEGFSDDANMSDGRGGRKPDDANVSAASTEASDLGQNSFSQEEAKLSLTVSREDAKSVIINNEGHGESTTDPAAHTTLKDAEQMENPNEMRIGNIVYLPVEKNSEGKMIVKGTETESSTDDQVFAASDSRETSAAAAMLETSESQTQDQTDGGFRPFRTSAHHLSNFVNYATGLFRKDSEDRINVQDINEVIVTTANKTPLASVTSSDIEVESAIKLADRPELFQKFDSLELIARPATKMEDPPLYLCLRVGHPKNKEVSQTCPIESYRATKKKPEYWFSIPREKVDQLYAFFVQWTPEIYGDEDDLDPEKRGFVVIEDDEQLDREEHLEIVDEHFALASIQKIRKDWEIISKEEAIRRMSTIEIEEPTLPDMVGETKILSEEQLLELSQNLPPRTIGYTWQLIYSTELHGFSLKTLYRDMCHIDSPILLIVSDTSNNVFGAVTNCAFKISDHFYGTGECFLYTFYPEFKVFHWTGENNFFIKGNKESLAIGAGQGIFGLWFDGDLYHGRTHRCSTFDNDVLTEKEDFVLKGLEAWAFF